MNDHSENAKQYPGLVRVLTASEITDSTVEQVSRLITQLRGERVMVTREWLETLVRFPQTWLVVFETDGPTLMGMLTLSAFPRVSGWTPWIEGVVVDESVRGKGIGRQLIQKAIQIARENDFDTINLSCRPHRTSANALYGSEGFEIVPTNYRRLRL